MEMYLIYEGILSEYLGSTKYDKYETPCFFIKEETKAILSVSVTFLLALISHRVRRKLSKLMNLSLKTALWGVLERKEAIVFLAMVSEVKTKVFSELRIIEKISF